MAGPLIAIGARCCGNATASVSFINVIDEKSSTKPATHCREKSNNLSIRVVGYFPPPMTYEEKAKWIIRIFFLTVFMLIIAFVFAPSKKGDGATKDRGTPPPQITEEPKEPDVTIVNFDQSGSMKDGQIADLIAAASKKHGSRVLGIVHCHIPGNPDSEQIADILNQVAKKYGSQVLVIRVNILNFPEFVKAQQVTKPPEVLMLVDNMVAFKIQGLWPRPQIERKVDELIHGLRKVGKDWLPKVKGMQPAGGGSPSSP